MCVKYDTHFNGDFVSNIHYIVMIVSYSVTSSVT